MKVNLFWFRRDLRLEDNTALIAALLKSNVIPIFIFDKYILDKIEKNDSRLSFIHLLLNSINKSLKKINSGLITYYGYPLEVWKKIVDQYEIETVFWNKDYEPYSIKRDDSIIKLLESHNIKVKTFKDQVVFEEFEVLKKDNTPYTVFTPFKNKWLEKFKVIYGSSIKCNNKINIHNFYNHDTEIMSLKEIGFIESTLKVQPINLKNISDYDQFRNFPYIEKNSFLGPHLRFGSISVRKCVNFALETNLTFLSELIWREFFMQILFHFPHVEFASFKSKYNKIKWLNNKQDFKKWCNGETGYPLVDAGMRQLNATGYMHNRVRMITASFLVKHLLIDWRWGENYFAQKLLDYELSSNNGNWQWAAGTGCDSAPYFRIFNPKEQLKKYDAKFIYIKKWVDNISTSTYPEEMIDHKYARDRCLQLYKKVI